MVSLHQKFGSLSTRERHSRTTNLDMERLIQFSCSMRNRDFRFKVILTGKENFW